MPARRKRRLFSGKNRKANKAQYKRIQDLKRRREFNFLYVEMAQYKAALASVVAVLGPTILTCNKCEGCQAEMQEALDLAKKALEVAEKTKAILQKSLDRI